MSDEMGNMRGWMDKPDKKWVSHRYQSMTVKGMMESHPWLGLIFLTVLFLIVFLSFYLMLQSRNIREKDIYTKKLRENLAIIDRQKEKR